MIVEKCWFADLKPAEIVAIRQNREHVVVVDLWAATTNIVLMLGKRPARLVLVNDEKYSQATRIYPDAVLIGQSNIIPKEKFASSTNKSFDVDKVDIAGKVVLYVTFNGTRVLEVFSDKERGWVFAGSLTNYEALVNYLKEANSQKVTIAAAGNLTGEMGGVIFLEDWLGAEVFEKSLRGEKFDFEVESERFKQKLLAQGREDLDDAPSKIWPYIFGAQVKILPTSFINEEGFVEVVDYLSWKGVRDGPKR